MDRMSRGCGNGGSRKKDGGGLREELRRAGGKNGELRYTSDTPLGYLVGGGSRAKNESTKNLRSSHHDRERETGTRRPIVSWKLI